jgi:3-oxoadipate enol-lactonase
VRELPGPPGAATLMLLHGLSATADLNWFTVYRALGSRFRVVAMDHRGHGRGIRTRRPFRLADCADDVAALAEVLGIERLIPVGYSMGGPIAQLTWHRHPSLVEGLVLCATSRDFRGSPEERVFFMGLPGVAAAMRLAPPFLWRPITTRIFAVHPDDHPLRQWAMAEMRRIDPGVVLQAMASLGRFSSHDWIDRIDVPAAVVVTMRDRLVPAHRQLKLAAGIPDATVHAVDGDHGAVVMEVDRFLPALVEACTSVVSRARRPYSRQK